MSAEGNWNIVVTSPLGDQPSTLSLKVEGGALTGMQGAQGAILRIVAHQVVKPVHKALHRLRPADLVKGRGVCDDLRGLGGGGRRHAETLRWKPWRSRIVATVREH